VEENAWKIKFVGTGSAFNTDDYQSNMVIERNDKKLLIDCGMFAPMALRDAYGIHGGNIGSEIDTVYISHLHADHIGGMEWLAFCTYFNPSVERPKLLAVKEVMMEMWANSLSGGLQSIEGKVCDLDDYFECKPLEKNEWFTWEGIEFMPVQTIHIVAGFRFMNSYGLMIKTGRMSSSNPSRPEQVFLTTDTQ
jgi:ribonuclease BN (tRNA processing enzyme)